MTLLGIGFPAPPEPFSLAARRVNQPLAEAQAAVNTPARPRSNDYLAAFNADPTDHRHPLSDLADAYLAGDSAEDLQRGRGSSC